MDRVIDRVMDRVIDGVIDRVIDRVIDGVIELIDIKIKKRGVGRRDRGKLWRREVGRRRNI